MTRHTLSPLVLICIFCAHERSLYPMPYAVGPDVDYRQHLARPSMSQAIDDGMPLRHEPEERRGWDLPSRGWFLDAGGDDPRRSERRGRPNHRKRKDATMEHLELMERAKNAVQAVMGDTSVPKQVTVDSLDELLAMIEPAVEALESEIEAEGE